MSLPAPERLGLPAHFKDWRPNQPESILDLCTSQERYSALVSPTGSGKSLTYAAFARLNNPEGRTVILTSTKALQSQLLRDFQSLGMVDVRGQANYPCRLVDNLACDEGPCHLGEACEYRNSGCAYYDAVARAQKARLVVTNYSYWLSQREYGQGLGEFQTLILDEAHAAAEELDQFLSVEMTDKDALTLLYCGQPPKEGDWHLWARYAKRAADRELEDLKQERRVPAWKLKKLRSYATSLGRLAQADPTQWVMDSHITRAGMEVYRWDPIWPAPYAEGLLFQEIPRVLLVSATIRPKTMDLVGVPEYQWSEWPSLWPAENRMLTYIPTVRLNHRTDPDSLKFWLATIDQILDRRLDRKGILHTTSYARAQFVTKYSRHRKRMLTHESGTQSLAIEKYRLMKPPIFLVSPSATTGLNFPDDDCRLNLIGKLPFPDTRSKIMQARQKLDPEYPMYVTMVTVVQACGRGVRSRPDWCENIILDSNWEWFQRRYRKFAPDYFWASVARSETVPDPPKIP